jgi:hypothetical protein
MSKYKLARNGSFVRHIVMIGSKLDNFRKHEIVDLEFDTHKAAEEVATVLNAEVVDLSAKLAA